MCCCLIPHYNSNTRVLQKQTAVNLFCLVFTPLYFVIHLWSRTCLFEKQTQHFKLFPIICYLLVSLSPPDSQRILFAFLWILCLMENLFFSFFKTWSIHSSVNKNMQLHRCLNGSFLHSFSVQQHLHCILRSSY